MKMRSNKKAEQRFLSYPASMIMGMAFLVVCIFPSESREQVYPFKHYTTADGLVHAMVKKVFQDSRGYFWFCTSGGVSKYDGVKFTNDLFGGSEKSAVNNVWEDEKGTMWFTTWGNGIAKLQESDTIVRWMKKTDGLLPSDYTTVIFRDHGRRLWIGTDAGVVLARPDGSFRQYDDTSGLPNNLVRTIAEESDGTLWIGTDAGLVQAKIGPNDQLHTKKMINLPTYSLRVLRNGDVLAGTAGGGDNKRGAVFRYHSGKIDTLIAYSKTKSIIKGASLYESSQGDVWVGTSYGLYLLEQGRMTRIRAENGLQNEYINDILEDREGTLWLATNNGVTKLPARRFLNYGMTQGLSSNIIISMLEDSKRNLWFGTYNGLTRLESGGRMTTFGKTHGLNHEVINCLAEDADGDIWVGTPAGLNVISHGKIQDKTIDGLIPGSSVVTIVHARNGDTWLGSEGRIIRIVKGYSKLVLDKTTGIPDDLIMTLYLDDRGTLWFGTSRSGMGYYRNGKVRMLTRSDGLPGDKVNCIFHDQSDRIWIGTAHGAIIWQEESFTKPTLREPALTDGNVNFIIKDRVGHLWFGTEYGVYEYRDSIVQHFDSHDGLAADVVEKGIVDHDGNLWFGTLGGVSRFDRSRRDWSVPSPEVYLDKITVGNEDRTVVGESELDYRDRTITFSFNALSFVDERNMEFQWMMEGFDRGWLSPQKLRQARYTNLDPGHYAFVVRAANRNGSWSEPTRFAFSIRLPFWQKWWFLVLSMVSMISILVFGYRYRVNQLLKVERMRTRIAADLHDDVASSLASVAMYSEVIQRQLKTASDDVRAYLGRIRDLSREMMENISMIVWAVDPRYDELSHVLAYFKRQGAQLCAAVGVSFLVRFPEKIKSLAVSPERRRVVYLILKEGLNNILRHSHCSEVKFTAVLLDHTLELTLQDDGCGFDDHSVTDVGHGLHNMRMRAATIGAEMEITSQPGSGTTLSIRLKMK